MARPPKVIQRRYRVLGPLGTGGMGAAYRVWDEAAQEERALKLVDAASVELLRNEFALLAGLSHPRLLRVHDFGALRRDGELGGFYTADLLAGISLGEYARGRSWSAVRRALGDALEGLAFLHALGIRHGDFKPDNVIVDPAGRATLLDLSCAGRFDEPLVALCGTPGFIAPESVPGGMAGVRADIFAVGVTVRQLATEVQADLSALVDRLCDPSPANRPGDIVDVLAALGDDRRPDRVVAGRSGRLLGRRAEVVAFEDLLDAVLRDEPGPRGMVICGPSGIGKSRLLAELKWHAQLRCDVTEAPPSEVEARRGMLSSLLLRAGASLAAGSQRDGARVGLDAMLHAAEELNLGPEPCVLFIDDADRLDPDELLYLEAILRSLPEDGRMIAVVASERPLALEAAQLQTVQLGPLTVEAAAAWAGKLVAPRYAPELLRLTGGNPAYLEAAMRELASGRLLQEDLASAPRVTSDDRAVPMLEGATNDERWALALLVAGPTPLPSHDAGGCDDAFGRLAARGMVTRDSGGYRLARPADRGAIERGLGEASMLPAYRKLATALRAQLAKAPASTPRATLLRCLLRSGQLAEAERALAVDRQPGASDPRSWSDTLLELTRATREPAALLAIAEMQLELGRSARALSALARLYRQRPVGITRRRSLLLAGASYLLLERPQRAVRYLERALHGAQGQERVSIAARLVRALNQTGDYAAAAALAEQTLATVEQRSDVALELSGGLGIAATYLGRTAVAREHLTRAAELTSDEQRPRDAARARSYLAILAFRSGDLEVASAQYARALDIAERRQLSDMLPTLVLNLATARQALGAWGEAIALYERGHRVAVALGKTYAQAVLELNLAYLFADVGLADRAGAMLQRAERSIAGGAIDHLDGQRHTIAGEIALSRGELPAARACFERGRDVHRRRGETREEAEACLSIAATELHQQMGGAAAEAHIDDARRLLADLDAKDVAAHLYVIDGLRLLACGRTAEAVPIISRGLEQAEQAAQPLTVAEAHQALATAKGSQGDGEAARHHEELARASWMRIVMTLPRSMHDAFWRHPRRRSAAPAPRHEALPSRRLMDAARMRRMLELSARVSSTLSLDRVLDLAMDAAIELTGAERGFLLLSEADEPGDDRLRVAVARNVDRARLGRGNLEFSAGIAKQVLRSGEQLVTLDARGDQRFSSNRSVHAMRLKSVVCVPVSATGGVLGALYLDNRFEHGRFQEDDVGVVQAFANHIAMAIRNARLHSALEENHRRLAAEKRRVERLSRGQAQQIEALDQRVRSQQRVLERRYDYAAITHRSAAMQAVLDVLDRVIDSDLTVLIEGESGTGKELVARAVHFNSPRRDAAFVGVNCGALSETLLESELFGYTRGAFTGAVQDRAGIMVAAEGGTLFLDEVGELSLAMQVKLLRALQEREVRPLGSADPVPLDIRVVCATNRHLREEVEAGRFREDLYYRLGVVELRLPPLRERQEDILPIARTLLDRQAEKMGAKLPELSRDAVRALLSYRWPGNVRQLENALARAYVLSDRETLRETDLDLTAKPRGRKRPRSRQEFEQGEAERIHDTLLQNRWNVSRSARALGMPRNTLYRKLERLGLSRP